MEVAINGKKVNLKMDTGSDLTIITKEDHLKMGNPTLNTEMTRAVCASGVQLELVGSFMATIQLKGVSGIGEVHVSENGLRLF